jgi:LPXTG-motif cell wall-anchored protein
VPAARRIAALVAICAIGFAPGVAIAQSGGAGDDQYVDPFSGAGQQSSGGGATTSTGSPAPSPAPAPTLTASAAPAPSSGRTLPRTGADAGVIAAIGGVLLLAGVALRRRLADARH